MRAALLTAALMALGVAVASVPAQAADIYRSPPAYGAAPPPAYRPAPPPVAYVTPPPVYGPPPVVAYGPPPGVIAAPEGPAYLVQQPAYQPGIRVYVRRPPALSRLLDRMGSAPLRAEPTAVLTRNIAGSRNAPARERVFPRGGTEKPTCVDCCSPARPSRRSRRFRVSHKRKSMPPTCMRRGRGGRPAGGRRADGREPSVSRARHHLCAARHRMGRPADHHRGSALLSRLLVGLGPTALRAEALVVKREPRQSTSQVVTRVRLFSLHFALPRLTWPIS